MKLRDAINKVLAEWPIESKKPFKGNSLARFIRNDLMRIIESTVASVNSNIQIKASAGAGNWASVPWLAILDPRITNSTQKGIYPVYLFRADGSGVYLSLGQGTTEPTRMHGSIEAEKLIKERATVIRKKISALNHWKAAETDLRSNTQLGRSYEKANIGAHLYELKNLPSEVKLQQDLRELLSIYMDVAKSWPVILDDVKNPPTKVDNAGGSMMDEFVKGVEKAGLCFEEGLGNRVISSLKSSPFMLLTGLSGSGKTQLALFLSQWICHQDEQNKMIAVGASWTSKDDLLGYPDALRPGKFVRRPALELLIRAHENWKQTEGNEEVRPYFLILDEMNLSHVERYFSDFLSAMESGQEIELHDISSADEAPDEGDNVWDGVPARIKIPGNLFVIGTVNVDETTYMFSPKVLDRANVIEFRTDKEAIANFLDGENDVDLDSITGKGAHFGEAFVHAANMDTLLDEPYDHWLKSELDLLFDFLSDHEGEFGFRTVRTITRFIQFSAILKANPEESKDQRTLFIEAMDAQIMQKILPKMHGSKKKLGPVLRGLAELCSRTRGEEEDGEGIEKARGASRNNFTAESKLNKPLAELMKQCRDKNLTKDLRYPISFEKIVRMMRMLDRDGFSSFAEA